MNYSEQLKSLEWKELRKRILKRDNYECLNCKNQKITRNSHEGIIVELRQLRTALYLFNRNDPRFFPSYIVKYKDEKGVINEEEIMSHFKYDNSKLKVFENSKLYLSNDDYKKNGYNISCIPNYYDELSWFFVNRLDVHHKRYLTNHMAWEYPTDLLQTLCWICHKQIHS